MPTSAIMQIPKTRSEEEFEDICTDVLNKKYNRIFKRYGKKGQKQNGIDIYEESLSSSLIVAQCKNYINEKSAATFIKKVKEDFCALKKLKFYNRIGKFIVMTSIDRDTNVQSSILEINSNSNINIETLFWEDIQQVVCSNEDLLKKHYPQISGQNSKDIGRLKEYFNNLMFEKNILDFIVINPLGGIPDYLPENVDLYCITIKQELNRSILLQNNKVFKAIDKFINLLDKYNEYLSMKMSPTNNGWYIFKINRYEDNNKIIREINKFKTEMNKAYSVINEGCFIFYQD